MQIMHEFQPWKRARCSARSTDTTSMGTFGQASRDVGLVALALVVAESKPNGKDITIFRLMNRLPAPQSQKSFHALVRRVWLL